MGLEMGLSIGQSASVLRGIMPGNAARLYGDQAQLGFRSASRTDTEENRGLPIREEPRVVQRVGFGEGTVSVPVAAARTLGSGLDSARRVVPSVEELLNERRARSAEEREERARELEENEPQATRLEPVTAAKNYINAVNEAIGVANARLAGEEPPAADNAQAAITIGGETFDIRTPARQALFPNPPTIDFRV